jgi:hypothetical protein
VTLPNRERESGCVIQNPDDNIKVAHSRGEAGAYQACRPDLRNRFAMLGDGEDGVAKLESDDTIVRADIDLRKINSAYYLL